MHQQRLNHTQLSTEAGHILFPGQSHQLHADLQQQLFIHESRLPLPRLGLEAILRDRVPTDRDMHFGLSPFYVEDP